jgi:hypothetical protein
VATRPSGGKRASSSARGLTAPPRLAGGDFTAVLEAAEAFVDGDYT